MPNIRPAVNILVGVVLVLVVVILLLLVTGVKQSQLQVLRLKLTKSKIKGFGIVSEILTIFNDIPLGKHKMETGLMFRQAMLFMEFKKIK